MTMTNEAVALLSDEEVDSVSGGSKYYAGSNYSHYLGTAGG